MPPKPKLVQLLKQAPQTNHQLMLQVPSYPLNKWLRFKLKHKLKPKLKLRLRLKLLLPPKKLKSPKL